MDNLFHRPGCNIVTGCHKDCKIAEEGEKTLPEFVGEPLLAPVLKELKNLQKIKPVNRITVVQDEIQGLMEAKKAMVLVSENDIVIEPVGNHKVGMIHYCDDGRLQILLK